jgi:DNA-binding Xre family transcriptional regulator
MNYKLTFNKDILWKYKLKPTQISKESGVKNSTLSPLLNGKTRAIRFVTIEKIAEAINKLTGMQVSISDIFNLELEDSASTK